MKKILGGIVVLVALTEAFFGGVFVTWYLSLKAISENARRATKKTADYYASYIKAN